MPAVKVVVTGPFAAGKTTFIRTISEIAVLSTERDVSDHTAIEKPRTTVAMDFGRITIDPTLVLYLFGTPGQERFDFMWEILSEGMIGFILLTDPSRESSFEETEIIMRAFSTFGTAPYVVGVNKFDETDPEAAIEKVRARLEIPSHVPMVPINALDRESVKNCLLALLSAALEEAESGKVTVPA